MAGSVDLSLPGYAELRQRAGVDPDAEVARLTSAKPDEITNASRAFAAAGGEMDAAWRTSMASQAQLGSAFLNNGGQVYDRDTHVANMPAGFRDAGTQLADAGKRLASIAGTLVTQTQAAVSRRDRLIGDLQAKASAWAQQVAAAATLPGGLIPESAVPGLLSARDALATEMQSMVTSAASDIVEQIKVYEAELNGGRRLFADQGFVTPEELAATAPVALPVTYEGNPNSPGYVDPAGLGTPLMAGYAADPVNTGLGNFVEIETDLPFTGLLGALTFARTYNSRAAAPGRGFGPGWASWASASLVRTAAGCELVAPDGQCATFPRERGGFGRVVGVNALVEERADGLLSLRWFDGRRWDFDAAGHPLRISAGPGTEVEFSHDASGRLVEMAHARGRRIELSWDDGRIVAITASDGRRVGYTYDDGGHLVHVDAPAGSRRYGIDAVGLVASVTDADGVVEVRNTYDEHGRVLTQVSPFGRCTTFTYLPGDITAVADDSGGPSNTYVHDRAGRLVGAVDGTGETLRKTYDEWGNPTSVIDRNGEVTVQEWDDRARLTRRVLPSGAEYLIGHDDADRVVCVTVRGLDQGDAVTTLHYEGEERTPSEIVDPEGGVTRLRVVGGLVEHVVDADGVFVRFSHDRDGNLVEAVDAAGNATRVERDAAGRPVAVTSPAGRRTELTYDARGLPVERRDAAGGRWRAEYTPAGRTAAVVDPLGARTEVRHGEHGRPERLVDPLGAVATAEYDLLGNLARRSTPDGATWTYTYDALCRLSAWTDPAGACWSNTFDVEGNLVAQAGPTGTTVSAVRDPAGRVTEIDDGAGARRFDRDALGNVVAEHHADGGTSRTTRDRCGRVLARTGPDGGTTCYAYSPAGRLLAITSPAGRTEEFTYDECGRLTTRIDGAGGRWEHRRDADGWLVERVGPAGLAETFEHDGSGRLIRHTVPGRGTTRYEHDAAGRVVAVTDPLAGTRRFRYDAAGRMTEAVDALGNVTRYRYDAGGRLSEVTDPLGAVTTRTYDEAGRLRSVTDPLGHTTDLVHDAEGRLVARTDADGTTRRWDRDPAGRVRGVRTAAGDGGITVDRDAAGRPVRISEPGREPQELRYDAAGRLVERRRGALGMTWEYDADGQPVACRHPDGTLTTYERDGSGRVVAMHHPRLGDVRLDRDPDGRLTGLQADLDDLGRVLTAWTFEDGDRAGHETTRDATTSSTRLTRDATGRVVRSETDGCVRRYGYDAAGQLVSMSGPEGEWNFAYDAGGRLVHESGPGGQERDFTYDAAGRLGTAGAERFGYDACGRRAWQEGPDGRREYGWDGHGRLTRVTVTTGHGARTIRFTVDAFGELAAVDDVALMWDATDPVLPLTWIGDRATWPYGPASAITDWQGTPVGADGPADPWGAGPGNTGVRPGYRGELAVDGLLWLRNRVYDPATRAFLTVDPLAPVPGTPYAANPYHYAGNNPVDLVDPLGLQPLTDAALRGQRDQGGGLLDRALGGLSDLGSGIVDTVETGFRYTAGGALALTGAVASLPGPHQPVMHGATGLVQAGATMLNGDFDPAHIGRNFVNGPTTTFGLGLGLMGGGDISYDRTSGMWTATGADWGFGRGGTTYGSTFVTGYDNPSRQLLGHEEVHSEQFARYGGGIGFPIAYFTEELFHPGAENRFEREAGLEAGGYR